MKTMGELFKLPLHYNNMLHEIYDSDEELVCECDPALTPETAKAICHAINNFDQAVSDVKRLMAVVKAALTASAERQTGNAFMNLDQVIITLPTEEFKKAETAHQEILNRGYLE